MHRSSRPDLVRTVAIALALTTAGMPARADVGPAAPTAPEVLVWPLPVDDALSSAARDELSAATRAGLERARVSSTPPADAAQAAACDDDACTTAIARTQGVRFVVRPTIHIEDRNWDISATLLDATRGTVIGTVHATCELCGTAEGAEALADQIATLARKLERVDPPPARLHVASDPAGAEITVDGRALGRTPRTITLTPGRHRIALDKPGWTTSERTIAVVGGVDETMRLELQRARRPLVGAGIGLLVGGIVLGGTGGALWGIDGRPYRGRCEGDDVDYAGRCRYRYDTSTAGIVLTSIGIAAVIGGIALLAASRRSARRR